MSRLALDKRTFSYIFVELEYTLQVAPGLLRDLIFSQFNPVESLVPNLCMLFFNTTFLRPCSPEVKCNPRFLSNSIYRVKFLAHFHPPHRCHMSLPSHLPTAIACLLISLALTAYQSTQQTGLVFRRHTVRISAWAPIILGSVSS